MRNLLYRISSSILTLQIIYSQFSWQSVLYLLFHFLYLFLHLLLLLFSLLQLTLQVFIFGLLQGLPIFVLYCAIVHHVPIVREQFILVQSSSGGGVSFEEDFEFGSIMEGNGFSFFGGLSLPVGEFLFVDGPSLVMVLFPASFAIGNCVHFSYKIMKLLYSSSHFNQLLIKR